MKKINKNNVRVGVSLDRILRYLKGNKRKAGMTVILIVAVFIVMLNSSFGYFQKRIEGRRFSFVVGTLSIELDSQDLTNNQLTIQPRKSESITVSVTNKNNVDTKYLLYYKIISPESLNDNIEGGYLPTSKSPAVGIVSKKGTNNIELIFNNTITQNVTIEIGAKAGLKNGEILLEENEFSLGKETAPKYYYYKYDSQTSYYTFQSPVVGTYQIELWGAQGGSSQGGKGAYTSGTVELNTTDPIYIYLGGQGGTSTSGRSSGGYNGGGQGYSVSSSYPGTGGGGATDVRLINGSWNNSASLASRIMVASGGGGMSNSNSGSPGGTLTGLYTSGGSTAGTQISGGKAAALGKNGTNGGFGYGGNSGAEAVGGGGSGYYGGAGASQANQNNKGAPSGSSFISGHVGCIAINSEEDITPKVTTYTKVEDSYHYSNYIFYDTIMKAGNETMPTPDLTSTMTGNSGNGYATITLLQSDDIYLTSNDIKEGYVTIEPNSSINTDVYLTKLGLNDIYYGIYYEIVSPQDTTNTIEVGYSLSSKNKAQGIISYNETKEVNMIINNIGNSEVTLKIGLKKESKESDIEYGTTEISCNKEIIQKYYKYKYSGNYEEFVSVVDGIYKIEL